MNQLPTEAQELLAVPPAEFVEERKRLARQLRAEGRSEEARAVASFAKPAPTVLAVNRAARSRPKAAEAACKASERLVEAQLGSDSDAFAKASDELQQALELLAEVAIACVARPGTNPTEAVRRRVRDLLRGAVANEQSRRAL